MDNDPIARPDASDEALRPMDEAVRLALVDSHRDLLKFLNRRLNSPHEAEEVLQRFMLKAMERAGDLRDVKSVKGWLSRVLTTTIADFQRAAIRRRKKETVVDPHELAETSHAHAEPDDDLEQAVCDCLYRLLPTLKPEYAEVIWRADLLEEPRESIAQGLNTTVNNVTVRLHRARRALKTRLLQMCRTCIEHGFLDCHCAHEKGLLRPEVAGPSTV
jgi:RNA polymerase sigma-70 factor (ECF subfamily)